MAVNSKWSDEKARYLAITVFGLIIGLMIGRLWLGLAITFMSYSAWILYQAFQVEQWLQKGAHRNTAPDADGIIGHIEQLIFRRKQSDKDRKARLKQIVSWYNRSAEALPYGTVVTDDNYEIAWANEAAQSYLGIRGTRDVGQRIDSLVRNPEFQEYVRTPDSDVLEIEIQSPVNPNLMLAIRRVAYAENLFLFSARDISQRVRLQKTRASFVANASHELKTPLTVVNGYLEMLADDESLPASTRERILLAEKHANRMSDIVTDLLTLSRLENHELDTRKMTAIDIPTLLQNLCSDLKKRHQTHQLRLQIDTDFWLSGSENEIKSVCSNLCQNAIQHTPAGTTINITWLKTDGGIELSVSDDGPGITPQHLTHITERFYRVDSDHSRESGGTGLGLSIVKHIVQRHRGQLEIESTPGSGTRFTVRFPAEQAAPQPARTQSLAQ